MANAGLQRAEAARRELHETLELLAVRLDYPTRVDNAIRNSRVKMKSAARRKPLAFAAGVIGVGLVAGAVVSGVTLMVLKATKN